MKNLLAFFLLLAFSFTATAQQSDDIVIGKIDTIHSKILNEDRSIWVHVPGKGAYYSNEKQRYPVVYLLDGDAHFYSLMGMIDQLSTVNGNTLCPQMIVVGITNTDRTRDLTPTHFEFDTATSYDKTSGGGENFIAFLEKELMPYIDSVYPTQPYKMLVGHSFGGLLAMHIFVHHPALFKSYVAIDPSMYWDNQRLLKEVPAVLAARDYSGTSLYLGIANTLPPGMDTLQMKKDTTLDSWAIRSNFELRRILNNDKKSKLNYKAKYYPDEDHGASPLITEYDALRFIFNFHRLSLQMSDYMDFNKEVMAKIEKHYEQVSKQMGYKVKVPEQTVNELGYHHMAMNKLEEAEYLFRHNVANYPYSSNAHDSLGDLLRAKGDKKSAIASYKTALSIKEVADTRRKLEELQAE